MTFKFSQQSRSNSNNNSGVGILLSAVMMCCCSNVGAGTMVQWLGVGLVVVLGAVDINGGISIQEAWLSVPHLWNKISSSLVQSGPRARVIVKIW